MGEGMRNWAAALDRSREAAGLPPVRPEQVDSEAQRHQSLLSALESLAEWTDKDFDKANSGRAEGIERAKQRLSQILSQNRPTVEQMVKLCVQARIKKAEDVLEVVRLMGMNNTEAVVRVMKMVEQDENIKFE